MTGHWPGTVVAIALLSSFARGEERSMNEWALPFAGEGAVRWETVNDGVMGGVSTSRFEMTEDNFFVFRGVLSLENSGGFASVRTAPDAFDLSAYEGILLRVKGDGRTYQLRIRTDDRFDGVAYRAEFATKPGEWVETRLPFGGFTPTFRGRPVPDAPPLDPAGIRRFGFLLADGRPGPFRLEVKAMGAYGDQNKPSSTPR